MYTNRRASVALDLSYLGRSTSCVGTVGITGTDRSTKFVQIMIHQGAMTLKPRRGETGQNKLMPREKVAVELMVQTRFWFKAMEEQQELEKSQV